LMTHQSGIGVANELNDAFGTARQGSSTRWLKAQIREETVVLVKTQSVSNSLEHDFGTLKSELLPKTPCYILFRLDSKNSLGFEWLLLAYVPDGSTVRDRMLYASSRDTVKRQLGATYFRDDIHGTTPDEFTYEAYLDFENKKTSFDTPMTATELQTRAERTSEVAQGTSKEYVHSVQFPISSDALDKLRALNSGSLNLVQLKVDPNKETIELADAKNTDISGVQRSIPDNEPRFSLFRYPHTHEDERFDSVVFVYSCTNNSPVKLKMLYSTVKAVANSSCESVGLKIDKRIEVSEGSEFTEELLQETLHPPVDNKKQAFAKPSRPGKGGARLVKK